jgi:glutathione S-transferase
MADALVLYRAPFSTNVERMALALAHKGLEVESVVISYEDRSPVVEASGQGLVPVLVDGAEVVADSTRILRRDLLFGDELSAADCAAFPFLKYAELRDPADDELFHRILEDNLKLDGGHPRLSAWIDRVNERPRA